MPDIDKIVSTILPLTSMQKLELVDQVLASIYPVNNGAEEIWKNEADERVEAYEKGYISTIDEKELFSKYKC